MIRRFFIFSIPLVVIAFVFRDFIFFGKFFFNGDVLLQNLPFLLYRGAGGSVILQNMLSGFPVFATVNASWFYPVTTFFFTHLPATTAYLVLDIGNIVLAYFCTYLYARKMRLSTTAAALSALTFVFSGQLTLWAPSIIMTAYYFILPAALYLFELALERKSFTRVSLLAVAGVVLGSGWLSSQVQFVFYIHIFVLAYVAYRVWGLSPVRSVGAWFLKSVGYLGFPYLVSGVVGLPMILSVLSFQHETVRSTGVSLAQAAGGGYLPTDFLHYVLPFWNLSFFPVALPNLYIGILPFLLLLIVLFSYKRFARGISRWYIWTFLVCILISIKYSPLAVMLHYLPFWNAFREAQRIMFIGGFAAALLAGMCLDYVRTHWDEFDLSAERVVRVARTLFLYIALPVFALFTLVRLFLFSSIESKLDTYFLSNVYAHTTGLPKEHYLAVVSQYLHQALDQFSLFDMQGVGCLLFSALTLLLIYYRKHFTPGRFALGCLILASTNFAYLFATYYPSVTTAHIVAVLHTVEAVRAAEKGDTSPYRVFSIFPAMTIYNNSITCASSPDETLEMQNELLQTNSSIFFGIDSVDGYENFMPARTSDANNFIGSADTAASNPLFLTPTPLGQKIDTILSSKNVLRAMNVKYITSGIELSDPDLKLIGSWAVGHCKNPIFLYRLHGTWPRYFVSTTVRQATTSVAYEDILGELNTYTRPALLFNEGAPALEKGVMSTAEVVPDIGSNTLTFHDVRCASSCAFFIGNTFLDGWHASVDGAPAPLLRTNYLYMGLVLEKGVHTVVLTYK